MNQEDIDLCLKLINNILEAGYAIVPVLPPLSFGCGCKLAWRRMDQAEPKYCFLHTNILSLSAMAIETRLEKAVRNIPAVDSPLSAFEIRCIRCEHIISLGNGPVRRGLSFEICKKCREQLAHRITEQDQSSHDPTKWNRVMQEPK